jgi:hypothetical protein
VVNVVGFVVVFMAERRQPQGHVFKRSFGVPLGRRSWKCINIRMAGNESEFILGKVCRIH